MTELATGIRPSAVAESRPATVGIVGVGRLREAIEAAVAPRHGVAAGGTDVGAGDGAGVAGLAGRCAVVVTVSDGWATDYGAIASACRDAGTPWLPVRVELGQAVIGPLVRPGSPGCTSCAEMRRRAARPDGKPRATLHHRHGRHLAGTASTWLTGLAVDAIAALVAAEIGALLDRAGAQRTRRAVLCIALDTLTPGVHPFLPDPLCADCGGVPADTADGAIPHLRERPKPAPDAYRIHSLDEIAAPLRSAYVDAETGVVSGVWPREAYGVAVAEAPTGLRDTGVTEHGFGRTLDHRSSGLSAILEGLERYGGFAPARTRPSVVATYADVRDDAVDPRTLGLYPPERHRLPGFGYDEFAEDRELQWMWAYSFGRRRPILVPASFAYYGHTFGWLRGRPLTYETSNGCALGGCLEEAILYGILEVAERDAFLMTWYARLPVPRIDLGSARDRRIPLLAERVARATGYEILAFATTMEQGVPACLVMAVDRRPEPGERRSEPGGPRETGRVAAICAAGAHLDPERAFAGALAELVPMLAVTPADYARQSDRVRAMVDDPDKVHAMTDHALLYCDPATTDRMDFLLGGPGADRGSGRPLSFAAAFGGPRIRNDDLRDDLTELVDRYLASGLDVIVVDQTAPEHRAGGLSCVKVIIPGMLPMTFGHRARRTDGLPRLLTVPQLLGYRDRPLEPADVNPHPHPFP